MTIEFQSLASQHPALFLAFMIFLLTCGATLICGVLLYWWIEDFRGAWRKPYPGRENK